MNLLGTTNAGHTIIQYKETAKDEGIVLAYKLFNTYVNKIQFVTWLVVLHDGKPDYYWGHYFFDNLRVALEDFEKRD